MSILKTNLPLKLALVEKGSQVETCRILNIHPSKLSGIIGGYIKPNYQLKRKISKYLDKPIQELFPENEGPKNE